MNNSFAVIFDVDGVIVNSPPYNHTSINSLFRPNGFTTADLKDTHNEAHRGQSLRDILKIAKEKYGVDFNLDDFSKQAGEIGFKMMEAEDILKLDAELLKLLNELKASDVLLGIGTSSMRWRIDVILAKLGLSDFFPVIVSAEDVSEHKPNPHIFLEVAGRLMVLPSRCIVIEDAPSGIDAAKRAGMKVIGFTGFLSEPDSLLGADLRIKSFSELSLSKLKQLVGYV
ncbi:MAG: HAD family phosphatase [Candidatus Kerfeldbacteria bacterium]|nr:HAD family phosphatase [Candidatus Kerfeldbacteria bacterium]